MHLDTISSGLYPQLFHQWVEQCSPKKIDLFLPAFTISSGKSIASSRISSDDYDKGTILSNITDDSYFSFRYRQNYSSIEVNTSGIIAGSKASSNGDNCRDATSFSKDNLSVYTKAGDEVIDGQNPFIFDRPFSFVVYDKTTKLVLYAGNYTGHNTIQYFQ